MLKYIELKTGYSGNGPAWIARTTFKVRAHAVFRWSRLKAYERRWCGWNYIDVTTGEEFWISNVKKSGEDRHWAGSGKILIQENAVDEYLSIIRAAKLNPSKYVMFEPSPTDIAKLQETENRKLK